MGMYQEMVVSREQGETFVLSLSLSGKSGKQNKGKFKLRSMTASSARVSKRGAFNRRPHVNRQRLTTTRTYLLLWLTDSSHDDVRISQLKNATGY